MDSTRWELYRPFADRPTPFAERRRSSAAPASSIAVTASRTTSTVLPSLSAWSQRASIISVPSAEISPEMESRICPAPYSVSSRNTTFAMQRAFQSEMPHLQADGPPGAESFQQIEPARADFRLSPAKGHRNMFSANAFGICHRHLPLWSLPAHNLLKTRDQSWSTICLQKAI